MVRRMTRHDDERNPAPPPRLAGPIFLLFVVLLLIGVASLDRCDRAHADTLDPLALAIVDLEPSVSLAAAEHHVTWARAAADDLEPELMLAIAWHESRLIPRTVSRRWCLLGACVRRLGRLEAWTPLDTGPYFCGVMQVRALGSRARCEELMHDVPGTYAAGAALLRAWRDDPACHRHEDRERCMLLGYGGGYRMVQRGDNFPDEIARIVGRLRRRAAANTTS